jgi:hypothetical protein
MSNGGFGIEDRDFWSDPWKTRDDLLLEYVGGGKAVTLLDAPKRVSLESRASVPLLVLHSAATNHVFACPIESNGILVAARHHDRAVFARLATQPPSGAGGAPGPGFEGRTLMIDLLDRFSIPLEPSKYTAWIVMRDQISNPVTIELVKETSFEDPEVIAFIERMRKTRSPAPVVPPPGYPLPSYQRQKETPAVPRETGVAITAERVLLWTPDAQAVLRGSFKLSLKKGERVPPWPPLPHEYPGESTLRVGVDGLSGNKTPAGAAIAQPTAIVPITLLVTGSKDAGPILIRLRVPSYDPFDEKKESAEITGCFALDLLADSAMFDEAQTLFVYAFAGPELAGPVLIGLVPPSAISGYDRHA